MHQSLLIPDATIGFLWKAVCSETGLYRLGRGQQKRSVMNLAGALLHLGGGKERKLLPIRTVPGQPGPGLLPYEGQAG
jgi:hypothetical protein